MTMTSSLSLFRTCRTVGCAPVRAAKSDFEPQASSGAVKPAAERTAAIRRGENDHGGENDDHDGMHEDMHRLSAGELSALFSNLARGCEKQYLQAQADLFTKLADSFAGLAPAEPNPDTATILKLLQQDLEQGYAAVNATASQAKDGRAAGMRLGRKVTRILNGLLQRYEKEGEAMLAQTEVWVCTVCSFVYVGDTPPALCRCARCQTGSLKKLKGGRKDEKNSGKKPAALHQRLFVSVCMPCRGGRY